MTVSLQMKDKYVSLNLLLGERVEEKGAAVLQLEQEADSLEEEAAKLEEELEERLGQGRLLESVLYLYDV